MSCNVSTHNSLGGKANDLPCGVNESFSTCSFLSNQVENCCGERQLSIAPQTVQTLDSCTEFTEYGGTLAHWDACIESGLTDELAKLAFPYCDDEDNATRTWASDASTTSSSGPASTSSDTALASPKLRVVSLSWSKVRFAVGYSVQR